MKTNNENSDSDESFDSSDLLFGGNECLPSGFQLIETQETTIDLLIKSVKVGRKAGVEFAEIYEQRNGYSVRMRVPIH